MKGEFREEKRELERKPWSGSTVVGLVILAAIVGFALMFALGALMGGGR